MAIKPTTGSKARNKARSGKSLAVVAPGGGTTVACWEDDPGDPRLQPPQEPIVVPAPNPSATPLPFKISGPTPPPQIYQPGTANFRFYAAASALRRTSDFWSAIIPSGTNWKLGKVLPVVLDDGVDLNAFYTRGGLGGAPGLHFFHDTVAARTFFSGESPDVVCHEMGHAVLDAIRPKLFDAHAIETAAFHESFGDMSAMLSALQVPSFRQAVISETGGTLNRSSRLSRLAEQLGAALRIQHPDKADADCLRNAANSFFYRDPQTLPTMAPASQISSEPHSFSRIFTAAFLDILAGVFKTRASSPSADDLLATSQDAAKILVGGILEAPIVPDYFSQVAAHMINFGEGAPFNGKYRDVLKSAFVRRGILSLEAAATVAGVNARLAGLATPESDRRRGTDTLPEASIAAGQFGLTRPALKVQAAGEPKKLGITSASLTLGPLEPRSAQNAAQSFTEDLFQRGRVDVGPHAQEGTGIIQSLSSKTHVIIEEKGELVLRRRSFDCGFD
jgi:hypothetical protein